MIYPKNITGPKLEESDLAEFIFDGAELTLPLFKIPLNDRNVDKLSAIKDFRNFDTSSWETDGLGNPCEELVKQNWKFEDSISFDNIAMCSMNIELMEATKCNKSSYTTLNNFSFKKHIIDSLSIAFEDEEDENMDDPDWPKIHNEFNYQCIKKPHLDWLQIQICFIEGDRPSPMAFIPIDNRFTLSVSFHMNSLHYQDRTNPYSDELIRQLEFDLFDEYMQSIDLRHSEETLKIIQSLR